MEKYINKHPKKQPPRPEAPRPEGKMPLVRGMEEQEVLLPSGAKRRLLVLDESQEKYKGFAMVFKGREEVLPMDPASLGIFHYLATVVADQYNLCSITVEQCAERAKKSRNTVAKYFTELQEAQYIRRIKDGQYMLSPYYTVQIRKRYFPILERAWRTGEVEKIRFEMARLDEVAKEATARNRRTVLEAGVSIVGEAVTVPEAESLPVDERIPYIRSLKKGERVAKALEKALLKEKNRV